MIQRASIKSAPPVLSTSDKAMWVTGWNEAVDALEAEQAQKDELIAWCKPFKWLLSPTSERREVLTQSERAEEGFTQPLYTHPSPHAEPTVKQPSSTGRAELIAELRTAHAGHSDEGPSAFSDAADMLEADAQELKNAFERVDHWSERYLDARNKLLPYQLIAQQVAVPVNKREPLSDDEIAEWFVSENGLEDSKMCIYLDFEAVIRAVEAHHGITPQGDKT